MAGIDGPLSQDPRTPRVVADGTAFSPFTCGQTRARIGRCTASASAAAKPMAFRVHASSQNQRDRSDLAASSCKCAMQAGSIWLLECGRLERKQDCRRSDWTTSKAGLAMFGPASRLACHPL